MVLLSGGLDSATTLAIAREEGFAAHALSFDYNQRHRFELDSAAKLAHSLGAVDHRVVKLDLSAAGGFGHSALTDDIAVPKSALRQASLDPELLGTEGQGGLRHSKAEIFDSADLVGYATVTNNSGVTARCQFRNPKSAIRNPKSEIPITYVPARNTIFLSVALGYAEVIGAFDIFIGVNAIDYSGYPDCRAEFIEAFERMANLATAAAVEGEEKFSIHAPLISLSKAQIIRTGLSLGVDYALTHSCYDPAPDGAACGCCQACRIRLEGFAAADAKDPVRYAKE